MQVIHELDIGSGHSPLVVHRKWVEKRSPKPFRFENMWLLEEECKEVVKTEWHRYRPETLGDLDQTLSLCGIGLTNWSKHKNNKREIERLKKELDYL